MAARLRAFGPGHVDHAPSRAQAAVLSRIVDGREAGPLLDCSRLAVISADAAVVGVALVTDARPSATTAARGSPTSTATPTHGSPGSGRRCCAR